ncbi:FAD-dependent monooxygenase [Candidatus Pelagibacter sp. HIMB1321]|uniref:FAD-dependent monooxygenase n=1 Tax=Candidatus Pelagibacter sp. HIMB1321 TaxID=1388755 RepID=UPI000A07F92A|nr:FAD-dependent monooxygenase [Candidatus Pelagibacter sp. HIMB1321]SMF70722.1 salicylate hydroxylase [Candidatus Pelagibacter sp. HIMB1321]
MKKIAIIGAGISGLYLANLFKGNKDYQITIYEKKKSIVTEEGYGIQLSVNSIKLLNKIGFNSLPEEEKFNPKKIDFYEIRNSKKICDLEISKFNSENCKYTTLKRSKLLQFLKNNLGDDVIRYNHSVNQIEYDNDLITLNFDNHKINCDYLIVSDGVFSKGKSLISNNQSKPIYNNCVAIRANISKNNLHNINNENISLFLGANFHYVVYPLNRDQNLNFIGILKYRLNSNEQANQKLNEESYFIEAIKSKLNQKISASLFECLQNVKLFPVFVSKNFYNAPQNTFLVGDAFFALSPSFAQGASQSIEGSYELYESILNNLDFHNKRMQRIKMINNRSNFNQFAFHLSNPIMTLFRNISLKLLTKNKKFLESYLGKVYKN